MIGKRFYLSGVNRISYIYEISTSFVNGSSGKFHSSSFCDDQMLVALERSDAKNANAILENQHTDNGWNSFSKVHRPYFLIILAWKS